MSNPEGLGIGDECSEIPKGCIRSLTGAVIGVVSSIELLVIIAVMEVFICIKEKPRGCIVA